MPPPLGRSSSSSGGAGPSASEVLNLRSSSLPQGRCVYLQSGDPGDFDGYFIAAAGNELARHTQGLQLAVVLPERRACPDRAEVDLNKHDAAYSEQVLSTSGRILHQLCPNAMLIRGPLNMRNVIPLKFVFSEPERYGALLNGKLPGVTFRTTRQLADLVGGPDVTSVVMDMNGAMGYLSDLLPLVPGLGLKIKASGVPIAVMAGVWAEAESVTLRVPSRDPRSTMNAIYHPDSVMRMLGLAREHDVPLLFITNNVCNKILRFEDSDELVKAWGLKGLMEKVAREWYGPHLKGKVVPFDWVSFTAMLLVNRYPSLVKVERRELWVGTQDPSVLVLRDPRTPETPIITSNLEGTKLWGTVDSVVDVDRTTMTRLAQVVAAHHAT